MSDLTYELQTLVEAWHKSLKARDLSKRTQHIYINDTATPFSAFLAREYPELDSITNIKGRHVSAYIESVLDRTSGSTAHQAFRSLRTFFRWLVDEDELSVSPMAKLKPPKLSTVPVPVIPADTIGRLFAEAMNGKGRHFSSIRDAAIMAVLLDCGPRVGEVCGMDLKDLNRERSEVILYGKGRKVRVVKLGPEAMRFVNRYLRARKAQCLDPTEPALWLSQRTGTRITSSTITLMLQRRCKRAGVPSVHPHQWRHTFGHLWQMNGGSIADLKYIMGHSDISTTQRYAESAAQERARQAHDTFSPMGGTMSP